MNTKQLKQKILSLAITGRLVPQDPSDEPACELLKRIAPKATPLETDQPLPQGWCATTLSTLCELTDGENVRNRELINLDAKFLRGQREGNKLKSGRLIPAGSLVILVDGENSGEVFKTPIEGYQGSTFKKLVIDENMHEEFVLQVINSHRTRLKGNKKGSAIPHLNKKLFREIQVPIPPLAEQKRIAEAVELWFAKIDQLEHDCEALSKFGKQVRKKLLTSAIAGRLVPQDPNDEPASELLHRINPKATPLETDEPLPQGWCATTVSVLCKMTDGKHVKDRELVTLDAKVLRGQQDGNKRKSGKLIPAKSLLILVVGENAGEVFRTPIDGYQGASFKKLDINENMHEEFVLQVLKSHHAALKKDRKGTATPFLKRELFREMPVPIPPLAEQKRIVEKLKSMFAVLDNLDALTA